MKKKQHIVSRVLPGSIAEELGVEPGDCLVSINDTPIEDVFDYHYLSNEEYLTVLIRKPSGEEWELEIEKEFEDDLGMEFENGLMDEYRSCHNKCIFCFIDQMPPGMRDTLYFKDDDSRLSFLQGNYVTLTNMSDHDIDRITQYHLEPINISFQTMNPELRCKMLHNRFAGDALKKVDRLYEAGIHMNGQIVLCKGWNDGKELEYSISKLEHYMPDEWYLLAERFLPEEERYDGYLQLENGVGMLRLLETEFLEALEVLPGDKKKRELSMATGRLAAPVIEKLAGLLNKKYPNTNIHVYAIRNEFFGERITVSGLLTGQDLKKQLTDQNLGERLLLPCNLLKSGETIFLDDMTVDELETALQTTVNIVKSSGQALAEAMLLEDKAEHLHTNEVNKYE